MKCPHCEAEVERVLVFSRFCQQGTLQYDEKNRPFYGDLGHLDHVETQDVKCPKCLGDLLQVVGEGEGLDDEHYILDMKHTYNLYRVDGTTAEVEVHGLIDMKTAGEILGEKAETWYDLESNVCYIHGSQVDAATRGVPKNAAYSWIYGAVIEGQGDLPFIKGVNFE